jgi:hypothetical protein
MSIRAVIAEVLNKRHNKVYSLEKVRKGLAELEMHIENLQYLASQVAQEGMVQQEFANITSTIATQTHGAKEEVAQLNISVSNLAKRFSKPTINIGVAGKARQGKSTLLQKISGLSNTEIPTSDELPCTGTKSKIYHSEGTSYARIDFYTKEEFLKEILYSYFEKLNLPKPLIIDEFKRPIPDLVESVFSKDRNLDKAVYEKLKFIHKMFLSFYELLSKPSETVDLQYIPEYVTQSGGRAKYLAVKTANIYTQFPNHDVTGLGLVDLPGLEAAQGHEKKLVSSLEYEVDAVILVKLPSAQGTQYDVDDYKVIDLINHSVKEVELANWLFIVLNELNDESNEKQVQLLKYHPPQTYSTPNILIANCKDVVEVEEKVFAVVLKHIEHNLESIDRQYINVLAQKMDNIFNTLSQVLMNHRSFFSSERAELGMETEYSDLFTQFLEDLTVGLEDLVSDGQQTLTAFDEEFKQNVEEVCEAAKQNPPIPDSTELAKQFKIRGGWPEAIQPQLNHLRAHLTQHLAAHLDVFLQTKIDGVLKELLRRIFPPSLLKILPQKLDTLDPKTVVRDLQKLIDKHEHAKLNESFEYILKFNFSYHSHFHYRVRKEMGALDTYSSASTNDIIPQDATRENVKEKAEEIARGLENLYQQTIYRVKKKLTEEMQADPANAIFALIEEIKDRLIRTKGIEREWRKFLYPIRSQVWADTFSRFDREATLRKQWLNALDDMLRCAQTVKTEFTI